MAGEESIWKKEITFRRKPKEEKPLAEGEEPSIWNRPIALGRKPKEDPAAAAWAAELRELRGQAAQIVAAPVEAPAPAEPAEDEPSAAAELAPPPVSAPVRAEPVGLAAPVARGEAPAAPAKRKARRQLGPRRAKALVGLDVGAAGIAAAHVVNGGTPRVLQVAHEPLPAGIVVGGEARRPDELAAALKEFFRTHKLPRGPVRLGVANNRIGIRVVELSGIEDRKQLGNAVRFRAQEVLPIPLEEAVLDYRVLDEETGPDGKRRHRVLLVVAHRQLVEGFASACRAAGLKLAGIDLEAFGLLRALTPPEGQFGRADDAALVVVSIGHDLSTLAVSDGAVCDFARVIEWGGGVFDAAVARALGVTPEHSAEIREAAGLVDGARALPEWLGAAHAAEAREAMRGELQSFARDLVASLRFYQEQPGSLGIAEIVLTGAYAHLHGIDAELANLIGVVVRVGDPVARVRTARKVARDQVRPALAAAIGLGIDD
jgi:type IV pilus assembly protein PilM